MEVEEDMDPATQSGPPVPRRNPFEPLVTKPSGITSKHGEDGTPIPLASNFYRLSVPQDVIIYSYRVDFDPPIESTRLRRALVYEARPVFNSSPYVFDGGYELKSLVRLPNEVTTVTGTRKTDNATIQITIKFTGNVSWGHPEMMRFYNTQMKRNLMTLGMIQIGRHMFDKNLRKRLPRYKIEIWSGIVSAINEHDGGILMVNDVVHKVVRSSTAYEILQEMVKSDRTNFRNAARKELPGKIVMTTYSNKTYKVDDIDFDHNPSNYYFERAGTSVALKDYYKTQHNITIKDPGQPLLVVQPTERNLRAGQDKPIVLVPELVLMTGLSDEQRSNFELKKEMADMTKASPSDRAQALNQFVQKLNTHPQIREEMSSWNLRFEDSIVELQGRILPAEQIFLQGPIDQGRGEIYNQRTGSFEREIRTKPMRGPMAFEEWGIICLRKDKALIDDYCNTLSQVVTPLGVQMKPPKIMALDNDRTSTYIEACRKVPKSVAIINVIVPNNNKDRYDAIKRIFCCETGIPSQVVTTRTLGKRANLKAIVTKIVIQMTVKVGAEAWALHIPPRSLMICGYDNYHDTSRKGRSVGAFIASTNSDATKWYSRTSFHQSGQELVGNLMVSFSSALQQWKAHNRDRLPDRILIYRDGVSEGQIQQVYEYEVEQLKTVLNQFYQNAKVGFIFTIVTKRINARFFAKHERGYDNPPPGTVVDTVVTRRERFDFFLISQAVRQGTVNPTMFNIVSDNTGWKPQHHQRLAYKMCHLYFNWAGTITVPAPCQYAHKLAYLVGTSLNQEPRAELANTLYFL